MMWFVTVALLSVANIVLWICLFREKDRYERLWSQHKRTAEALGKYFNKCRDLEDKP